MGHAVTSTVPSRQPRCHVHCVFTLQTDQQGRPRHFAVQLLDGSVVVTTDVASETLRAELRVAALRGMLTADVSVRLRGGLLILRLDPDRCNDGPQCLATVVHSGTGANTRACAVFL